ncbi:hypothetical protein vseg_000879 [Gypsophila vaccaria]
MRIRREQSACGTDTDKRSVEEKQLSSFPSLPGPKAVFPVQIKDLGLLLLRYF